MNPVYIVGANTTLGAPKDWDSARNGECSALAVRVANGAMESAWLPTPEERAAIALGQPVILTIWGNIHPPVSVNVQGADHGKG